MNLVWEPGNNKQGYVVCISVFCDNGEINSTKSNVEIIFSKYHEYSQMSPNCEFWRNWYWVVNKKKLWILSTVWNI